MKKIGFLLILALLIWACNNSENESGPSDTLLTESETITEDDLIDEIILGEEDDEAAESEISNYKKPESLSDFRTLFEPVKEFPIEIDSIFISNIYAKNNPVLHYGEIEIISKNHIEDMPYTYSSKDFFAIAREIDSSKLAGIYDDFINKTASYEIQYSEVYACLRFHLEKTECFIWAVSSSTGEGGGPNGGGTEIYISFVKANEVISNYIIGEIYAGGDSPMYEERMVYTSINEDGIFNIFKTYIESEYDHITFEDVSTVSTNEYMFMWKDGSFINEDDAQ